MQKWSVIMNKHDADCGRRVDHMHRLPLCEQCLAFEEVNSDLETGSVRVLCPVCKSCYLTTGQMQTHLQNTGIVWQEIQCRECHTEWQDRYKLSEVLLHK